MTDDALAAPGQGRAVRLGEIAPGDRAGRAGAAHRAPRRPGRARPPRPRQPSRRRSPACSQSSGPARVCRDHPLDGLHRRRAGSRPGRLCGRGHRALRVLHRGPVEGVAVDPTGTLVAIGVEEARTPSTTGPLRVTVDIRRWSDGVATGRVRTAAEPVFVRGGPPPASCWARSTPRRDSCSGSRSPGPSRSCPSPSRSPCLGTPTTSWSFTPGSCPPPRTGDACTGTTCVPPRWWGRHTRRAWLDPSAR